MTIRIPSSTYRVQLNHRFGFADVVGILDYLRALGITDVYSSPLLAAQPGSEHGYDVIDPGFVNEELGGEAGLVALAEELRRREMGLIVDFVPNHMCVAEGANRFWNDVLENGHSSPFAPYFDIDWNPPKPDLAGKVLLPVLGDQYGRVLENQELQVQYRDGAFELAYFQHRFPLAPKSWPAVLGRALELIFADSSEGVAAVELLESILTGLRYLPPRNETDPERLRERNREKTIIKSRLAALLDESAWARRAVDESLREINGRRGDPQSFDRLDAMLDDQAYRLAFWRVATDEINYRRFFDINELAAIRIEDPEVFAYFHATLFRLIEAGHIHGLRIDHVDGLFDPAAYLAALHRHVQPPAVGEGPAATTPADPAGRKLYLVVEKILAEGETIPQSWPIHGTTGYDFLNLVGGVFVDRAGADRIYEIYSGFTGQTESFADLVYRCKKLILRHSMSSQVAMLARRLDRISEQHRHSRDFTFQSLQEAFVEVLAQFPVYRTYVVPGGVAGEEDRRWIRQALAAAIARNPAVNTSHFEFVGQVLMGEDPPGLSPADIAERRGFVLAVQQLTGAVMAKAVEDTAFYRFFPLASRGEVGGAPADPGVTVAEFHRNNFERLQTYPHGLLSTMTHDAKRSEDVRARIRVLAEMPEAWQAALAGFRACNAGFKASVGGRKAPDANEEYLLYQTLIGVWPVEGLDKAGRAPFVQRVQGYMQKALREAKVNSSWLSPNQPWEDGVMAFVENILTDDFIREFSAIQDRTARVGMYGSLAQVLLKAASPGVPDFYQGNELWDLSLVDPDNRRPVDFELRARWLAEIERDAERDPAGLAARLLAAPRDGRIKLFVTARALQFRRRHRALLDHGGYVPLTAHGTRAAHAVAFARIHEPQAAIVVVGRMLLSLGADRAPPIGERVWGDTNLRGSGDVLRGVYRDVLTGLEVPVGPSHQLDLARVFAVLPVALLKRVA